MTTRIGPFEILSELAKSPTGTVYKANDSETKQTIALKAIQLSSFGESAEALEHALLEEAEATKVLSSPNIAPVFGAGEIEGQFCAAMEYVQGNSIATMLARKEGFSIWDLLDIGRQLCSALDHAGTHQRVHYSLEPAKVMCGWDGTIKILSFGVSSVGKFVSSIGEGIPTILYYMSPEQIQGQPLDARSNLFSLGAMFYEMVTERKAFDREDADSLQQCILHSTPVAPIQVNPKVHPKLSDLIMKALAKDPAQRYQNGRELLDDLEKCKESKTLAAKQPAASKGAAIPGQVKAAAQAKFATAAAKPAAAPSGPVRPAAAPPKAAQPARTSSIAPPAVSRPTEAKFTLATPKAAAAAAGVGSNDVVPSSPDAYELDLPSGFVPTGVETKKEAPEKPTAVMSSAVVEEPPVKMLEPADVEAPQVAVDPIMAEGPKSGGGGMSFSDIAELPPLKEVYIAPPPPPPPASETVPVAPPAPTVFKGRVKQEEKPKVQPREVAQKAIDEIKGVPPKLYLYALGGAGLLILAIGLAVTIYIHNQNSDDDSGSSRPVAVEQTAPQPAASQPAPQAVPETTVSQPSAPVSEPAPAAARPAPAIAKGKNARKKAPAPAPAPTIIPGRLAVDSTPQGAQVQLDGRSNPSWVTPFALPSLQPGSHSITVTKAGYSTDTRVVEVPSGNQASIIVHLSQLMATLVVTSDPAGANIYVDGRDTGTKTPAQVSVDKGQHVVLVRKANYIDETMSTQFVLGQTFNFAPTLRPLGNADSIKTVGGKMSKLFGGKGAQAGQATVSIHTQPKGAQVAINQHMMEKNSPLDVALDPGSYVIDITLSGYAPVHKIITADKGGKVLVDEVLQPQ